MNWHLLVRPILRGFVLILAITAHAQNDQNVATRRIPSPAGGWVCETRASADGEGQKLIAINRNSPESSQLLWTSPRWISVNWSPDGRFLAVTDHYDGHEAAVIIFSVSEQPQARFTLIFKTPHDDDRQVAWSFEKWKLATGQVVLKRKEDRLGKEPRYDVSDHQFSLGSKD